MLPGAEHRHAEVGTAGTTMEDALQRCEAEIARLEAENADLRRSAKEFGDLAERLNRMLRKQRDQDSDGFAGEREDGA